MDQGDHRDQGAGCWTRSTVVLLLHFADVVHFIGLLTDTTAKDVADTFLKKVWKLHRLPSEIISDMDAKFSGEFWESLCKSLGIKRKLQNGLSRSKRRTNGKNQPSAGRLHPQLRQL